MLESNGMVKKEKEVVEISDIFVEVMDQFLSFVYSGRFKYETGNGKALTDCVKMLPDLVYVVDKVDEDIDTRN